MPEINVIAPETNLQWYHCGHCGTLFQSLTHIRKDRRCSECGLNPISTATEIKKDFIREPKPVSNIKKIEKYSQEPIQELVTHKKTSPFMIKLLLSWVLVTGLIILAAKIIWSFEPINKPVSNVNPVDVSAENENQTLLNKSTGLCIHTLKNFLKTDLPELRSQYVMQPITAVTRMTRHQNFETLAAVSSPTLDSSRWSVVNIADEKSIEAVWLNTDGRRFDAIFRKEGEEWLLDWEYFVRYSDMPLPYFLSGNGDAEGEFRLLARERLAEERKNLATISIMFYAPVFGRPAETGAPSPEFLIQRNSREGKLLEAAFSAAKNKKRPFDAKLANHDPEGMIRVRVKIRRSGEKDTRAFEIVEIKACHWYSSDLPGFDVSK